ncbi:MAG: uroporphyrinogen-III synthase [Euryarchaeota archaeon]|nr:uroporphyrinogen-III synthase [Euryarchaeota archaeon]
MKTLAIIRPKAQLATSRRLVEAYGYNTIAASLIEVISVIDQRWQTFVEELRQGVVDYVILTSANGVHCSIARGLTPSDIPARTHVVAIGPKTQQALQSAGIRVDLMPQEFSSEGILQLLKNVAYCNIWLLRSAYGSASLVDELRRREAVVNEVTMYSLKQLCGPAQRKVIRSIVEGDVVAVLFTSSMTVRGFFECASRLYDRNVSTQALDARIVGAIGRPTAAALSSYGVHVDVVPAQATFTNLVASVHRMLIDQGKA